MQNSTTITIKAVLPFLLLAICLLAGNTPVSAGTWSAPVFFTTASSSVGGQNTVLPPNSGGGEVSGYYRVGVQASGYGVMIYSSSYPGYPGGDPYPLPAPLVNNVVYTLQAHADAVLNFGGEAAPYLYTTNGQEENYTNSNVGFTVFDSDCHGTYLFRNFTLTYDSVRNQWILTGPIMHLMALAYANNSHDYVTARVGMGNMLIY